jgi:hypothetical protein
MCQDRSVPTQVRLVTRILFSLPALIWDKRLALVPFRIQRRAIASFATPERPG